MTLDSVHKLMLLIVDKSLARIPSPFNFEIEHIWLKYVDKDLYPENEQNNDFAAFDREVLRK